MKVNRKKKLGSLLLILLVVSACAAPANNQPGVTETASAQSTSTELSSSTELCSNRYFPVREGATWTYKNSGSPAGEFQFTDRVSSVRADGFTLTSQLGNTAWTQEWACQQEGLVALQLGGAPAMTLTAQGVQLNLAVNNVSGVTFPRDIIAGNQWQHNLDFDGQVEMAGQSGNAQGTALTRFTVLGNETVTVPAGTFEAVKIQVEPTLDINVGFQLLSIPVTISGTYTYWFVQDVGWVKASGAGNFAGQTLSETIELQSYHVP
ncbi:MAG TPA: hypothetical protein VFQ23_22005 [Anaerolineales bacterium]|nr:hypothetical protein [Anaerolineales bacterium]